MHGSSQDQRLLTCNNRSTQIRMLLLRQLRDALPLKLTLQCRRTHDAHFASLGFASLDGASESHHAWPGVLGQQQ